MKSEDITPSQLSQHYTSWTPINIQEYFAEGQRQQSQTGPGHGGQSERVDSWTRESRCADLFHLARETQTKVPGSCSAMVDMRSMVNVDGQNSLKEFQDATSPHCHDTKLHDRPTLLNLIGAGEGAARYDQTVTMPVAVQFHEQDSSFENKANVATGSGSDLPCIMGKDSATNKDSVILIRRGQEQLIFPGPGEYTSNPGTKNIPLEQTPSGHLVMVIDAYELALERTIGTSVIVALESRTHQFHASPPPRPEEILEVPMMIQVPDSIPGFGPMVRGEAGNPSSSSIGDGHLPELPPLEEGPESPSR